MIKFWDLNTNSFAVRLTWQCPSMIGKRLGLVSASTCPTPNAYHKLWCTRRTASLADHRTGMNIGSQGFDMFWPSLGDLSKFLKGYPTCTEWIPCRIRRKPKHLRRVQKPWLSWDSVEKFPWISSDLRCPKVINQSMGFQQLEVLPKWRDLEVGPRTEEALRRRFRALTAATGGDVSPGDSWLEKEVP
jgi:hypothetical protein